MNEKDIETLRAACIVDRAVIQAMLECLAPPVQAQVFMNMRSKLEQFTVRTLNAPMPEAFVEGQRASAKAWLAVASRIEAR